MLEESYHVNAFNHPLYPIVANNDNLQAFHWDLDPFWVKQEDQARDIVNMTINAKADINLRYAIIQNSNNDETLYLYHRQASLNGVMKVKTRFLILFR